MTRQKNFAVFDGDAHVVEPRAIWEQYLAPEYRALGKHALWREDGRTSAYLKINGETHRDTTNINLPRHALWRPGMTWESVGELDPDVRHAMNEGAWEPQARLRDMDAMGVDQALLYPTWFAEGFHLGARPRRCLCPGPRLQPLDCRFLPGGPGASLCRGHVAVAEYGFRP